MNTFIQITRLFGPEGREELTLLNTDQIFSINQSREGGCWLKLAPVAGKHQSWRISEDIKVLASKLEYFGALSVYHDN